MIKYTRNVSHVEITTPPRYGGRERKSEREREKKGVKESVRQISVMISFVNRAKQFNGGGALNNYLRVLQKN